MAPKRPGKHSTWPGTVEKTGKQRQRGPRRAGKWADKEKGGLAGGGLMQMGTVSLEPGGHWDPEPEVPGRCVQPPRLLYAAGTGCMGASQLAYCAVP